jgi:hypothetical protein
VSWFARFLTWAVVLALPCWALSHGWQRGLALAVNAVLGAFGQASGFTGMDVGAPFDIGLFAALCLSGRRAPARVRRLALWTGIPTLIVLEVLLLSVALAIERSRPGNTDPLMRTGFYLADSIPWVIGPALWVVWLGRWELPARVGERVSSLKPRHPRG